MSKLTKEELSKQLDEVTQELISWLRNQKDERFSEGKDEKWSTGQNVDHLIKSTKALNKGMGIVKMVLKAMFGTNNREEKTFDELVAKYHDKLNEGLVAKGDFVPKKVENDQKNRLISDLEEELEKLNKHLSKWNDEDLSVYILPHPALGKLTIREMICFTIYHTNHHFNIIKKYYS